ncbi:MAG: SDR family NAD(P)-dependent oxidoreductase [Gammaproteobacteria bacterium]
MGDRLKDKVAVVTGSGRGIGRGVAMALAVEGAKVVVNDLGGATDGSGQSATPADDVVAEIKKDGGEAVANYDSVTSVEGGESIIQTAVDTYGKIDILVNNAGILRDRMIFNMSPEEWDAVIKVHLYGLFYCTKPAAILMRQQKSGRIISMSSGSGLIGNAGQGNYGAAKAGIAGFTRVVSRDLGRYGITVNCVAPAAGTRMTVSPEMETARQRKVDRGEISQRRADAQGMSGPDDVAPIVVYLATDAAGNINGCTFGSSGGRIALHTDPVAVKSIYKEGRWTLDELMRIVPTALTREATNPAPSQVRE